MLKTWDSLASELTETIYKCWLSNSSLTIVPTEAFSLLQAIFHIITIHAISRKLCLNQHHRQVYQRLLKANLCSSLLFYVYLPMDHPPVITPKQSTNVYWSILNICHLTFVKLGHDTVQQCRSCLGTRTARHTRPFDREIVQRQHAGALLDGQSFSAHDAGEGSWTYCVDCIDGRSCRHS